MKKRTKGEGMLTHCSHPENIQAHFHIFADRLEGLSLASDALNQRSNSGAFRDYIRLFESAFRCPMTSLDNTLKKYLNQDMGYTRQEILSWNKLRHSLSHADKKRSETVLFSSDAFIYTPRIKQAALDVLLNKKIWGSKSILRNEIWRPSVFTTSGDKKNPTIAQAGAKLRVSSIDYFGAFEQSWDIKLKAT